MLYTSRKVLPLYAVLATVSLFARRLPLRLALALPERLALEPRPALILLRLDSISFLHLLKSQRVRHKSLV